MEFFYAWRQKTETRVWLLVLTSRVKFQLIQSMDIDVCEATSEGVCEPESELDSDEISEDEDDYELQYKIHSQRLLMEFTSFLALGGNKEGV